MSAVAPVASSASAAASGKVCSACHRSRPDDTYSNAQLKRKGKRRCEECVASEVHTPQQAHTAAHAAAHMHVAAGVPAIALAHHPQVIAAAARYAATLSHAAASSPASAAASAASVAASCYFGQRSTSTGLPEGEGLCLDAQGNVLQALCGVWAKGELVRQTCVRRENIPAKAPLTQLARSSARIYPDGSCFVWEDQQAGLGTLYTSRGQPRRGGAWRCEKQEGEGFVQLKNGDRYTGSFRADKRHGSGTLHCANGDVFVGEWTEGERVRGVETKASNGEVYTGPFEGGWRQGEGEVVWTDGSRYRGQFYHNAQHGRGTEYYLSRQVYDGQWRGGEREGSGIQWGAKGDIEHCGAWTGDEMGATYALETNCLYAKHGMSARAQAEATLIFPCGAWYSGPLLPTPAPGNRRLPHGSGGAIFNVDDSPRCSGSFNHGILECGARSFKAPHDSQELSAESTDATGIIYERDTRHRYEGTVYSGKAHGHGRMEYVQPPSQASQQEAQVAAASSSSAQAVSAHSSSYARWHPPVYEFSSAHAAPKLYTGQFCAGSPVGEGVMQYADGSSYSGSFRGDRSGIGALHRADGSSHSGQWRAGRPQGHGITWDAQGVRTACGLFDCGKLLRSASVPRVCVHASCEQRLNATERTASLLFPDGRAFVGEVPSLMRSVTHGTMFDAEEKEMHSGAFTLDMQPVSL